MIESHQCHLADEVCQQARLSRDPRFDGTFFTGVLTTGIYCRSICPAPAPLEKNVRYFDSAIKAANAGLRPCLRCRPDSAPYSSAWLGTQETVNQAIDLIHAGYLQGEDAASITELATRLGVSSRYINILFQKHIGRSVKQYAIYHQLMLAKQLLVESQLSVTSIAMATGFNSIRRFNEAFQQVLELTPSQIRQQGQKRQSLEGDKPTVELLLSYRPPFQWQLMQQFYQLRQVDLMEDVKGDTYQRTFDFDGIKGLLRVTPVAGKYQLSLQLYLIKPDDVKSLMAIIKRVRAMFDLDADMQVISDKLVHYQHLGGKLVAGLRLPGVPSAFEAACRAILGQQVSVQQATMLLNKMVQHYAETIDIQGHDYRLFPTPEKISQASLDCLRMPGARKEAIRGLAQYICQHPQSTAADWLQVKGVGPWTIAYTQMRGNYHPDIFLATDLVIKNHVKCLHKNLGRIIDTPKQYQHASDEIAQAVSPWGSYLTIQMWFDNS